MMMQSHPIPRLPLLHLSACLNNRTRGFMTEYPRGRYGPVLDFLDVGRADTAGRHPHQQFVGADPRHRHRFHPNVINAVINGRLHGLGD
jgi:hypothetical protein